MDEARLTDGKGQQVSFRDAIIIMTSNLGVKETQSISKTVGFGNASEITREKRNEAFKQALKKTFKPEFLNRITRVINFDVLTKENYFHIIELELNKLQKYLRLNDTPYSKLQLCFDESLYEYIYSLGIDEKFGARPLHRTIEREISTILAQRLLNENFDCDRTSVNISIVDDEIQLDFQDVSSCDNPPFYLQNGEG
jgi:ATP-dependent Clp protease ATP-binding subunit ClpC